MILTLEWFGVFFRKSTAEEQEKLKSLKEKERTANPKRIRCPFCQWQPKKTSLWSCGDCDFPEYFYNGCYTAWNTFETGGRCPGCGHQWRWTSCLACGEWSRHKDWYETKQT